MPALCVQPYPHESERPRGGVEADLNRALILLYPQQEPEEGSCQTGPADSTGTMTTSHQPQDRYWGGARKWVSRVGVGAVFGT